MRAPIFSRPARWRSIGRAPIAQPPGVDTRAVPKRASSGPRARNDARMVFTSSYGASVQLIAPDWTATSWPFSACATSAPRCSSTASAVRMSASAGTWRSTQRSGVSSVANSNGSAAFFAPLTSTSPASTVPPSITMLSIPRPPSAAPPPPAGCRRDHARSRFPCSTRSPRRGAAPSSPAPLRTPPAASRSGRAPAPHRRRVAGAPRDRRHPPPGPRAARTRAPRARRRRDPARSRTAGWTPRGRCSGRAPLPAGRPRAALHGAHAARSSRAPPRAPRASCRLPTPSPAAARERARQRPRRSPSRRPGRAARAMPAAAPSRRAAPSPGAGSAHGDRRPAGATRTRARQRRRRRAPGRPGGSAATPAGRRRPDRADRAPPRSLPPGSWPARARAAPARRPRAPPHPRRAAARSPKPAPRRPSARSPPVARVSRRGLERVAARLGGQRVDHRVEVAVEHTIELVQGEIDAMIGDPALREVVRADLLRAVAAAHHGTAVRRDRRLLVLSGTIEQPRAQDLERLRLVLVLRLLVLAGHHQAGRQVGHAHRRVGGVDALPAGTGGTEDVDAKVLLGEVDLDVLGLGQDGNGHGRCVDPSLRLGDRHALYAVHAALELEAAVGALALHECDHLFQATDPRRARRQHLDPPPMPLRVPGVHPEELGREEAGLVAAGSGADLEHRVALVVGIARQQQRLQALVEGGELRFQLRQLAPG